MTLTTEPEPYRLTATEALANFRSGALTVEQYARSLLSRIAARDPVVKAWAYLSPNLVLAEAKRLDSIPVDQRGPLHGVAVAVKDIIYTRDMPTQFNSPLYENDAPKVDAASITMLRLAGALILGKTTTTEFAATSQGPPTTNPHDPSRTPGGSSSGSGAAVADFQAPLALGTQTGGSLIRPASFNGVYALKPTWNAVSREGQKVYALIFDTLGWYARSIDDLRLLADVFNLQDDDDDDGDGGDNPRSGKEDGFSIQGAKFGLCKTMVWSHAGPGTVSAMEKAASLLREHGATVEEFDLPEHTADFPAWYDTLLDAEGRVAFLPAHRLDKTRLADHLVGHVENRRGSSKRDQVRAFDSIAAARPVVDAILARYDAVVVPSVPDEAPLGLGYTGDHIFNSLWTAMHTPVVNVPGFQGQNGMPVGVSLVAPRYNDLRLLAVGKKVGEVFQAEGGWKPQD
ncbi:glutamyl-tRNA amidotransferase subunit A [Sodiomyces alkalinus F11]|uniref:Glutamyl-tRNA amidotransferase subunit A n=1 Tax=Sodiomyces alkalinus (strain CBS 110278 / VKM F-3762 / F11) TaxID=1314773 RepID=A0A3N2PUA4_SODAK|nr:glutamyl-tRNA amidotransferase subunit A [Sodiomyces alkalinus F11]ROT38061.1 glutamyl-tRNA amidotransferase subunit A [Sodiomyces alkalinus F11]